MDGATLAGWIIATAAMAGIYGAVTNETWFSVMARTVDPKRLPVPIDPHSPITGHRPGGYDIGGQANVPDNLTVPGTVNGLTPEQQAEKAAEDALRAENGRPPIVAPPVTTSGGTGPARPSR